MSNKNVSLEDIVSLCKRRGFIFQGSEVYGGLSGTWDYGPLGITLKKNLMDLWWKTFVEEREDMFGVDAAILMNQKVWQASGHVSGFHDPMVGCSTGGCGARYRTDHLVESISGYANKLEQARQEIAKLREALLASLNSETNAGRVNEFLSKYGYNDTKRDNTRKLVSEYFPTDPLLGVAETYISNAAESIQRKVKGEASGSFDNKALSEVDEFLGGEWEDLVLRIFLYQNVKCSNCGASYWELPRVFNMMFKTKIGPIDDESSISYLRPETAQGIFTNFKNVVDTFYPDLPFGIAQQGKAFRNEISPRDFVFRSREFNQMEVEYFIDPENWEQLFEQWRVDIKSFLSNAGVDISKVKEAEVSADDLAHYSKRTIDYEFDYPHGSDELLGLAYRTDFDLQNIQRESGKKMDYRTKDGSKVFVPHVIEPSFGVERLIMAVLCSAYREDEQNGEKRVYLALPSHIAPVKYCVSPLLKNKPELVAKAREVYSALKKKYGAVMWDDNGNIGKRYRRQDEIGTPYCVVVDFDSLEDGTVTVRDRDTTLQNRVKIEELV